MNFQFKALRFQFRAREAIHFPTGKSSNILRGAFGTIFRKLACMPECQSAATCQIRSQCPYAQMFEPGGSAPSGLTDWPRPFVFRAAHLDGQTISAGQEFHFDVNLFDLKRPADEYLTLAFAQLANEGLGAARRKVDLLSTINTEMLLNLDAVVSNETKLCVRFVTPTELKSDSKIAATPEFSILATRIRDRISALSQLYGEGAPDIDYKAFGQRAALVKMERYELQQVDVVRRSSRTSQVHAIGGFTGVADYQGPVAEFLPWLRVAEWTGVGRQTVWGKGVIQIVSAS